MKKIKALIKPIGMVLFFIVLIVFVMMMRTEDVEIIEVQTSVPVETQVLTRQDYAQSLAYTGIVSPDSVTPMAYKSGGKIETISVEVGDAVRAGDVLAVLDPVDLNFQLSAAISGLDAATAQYELALDGASDHEIEQARLVMEKAQEVAEFQTQTYEDLKVMFERELVSEKELEGARLEASIAEIDAKNAALTYEIAVEGTSDNMLKVYKSQMEQAQVNVDSINHLLDDSVLLAPVDGVVVSVMYEEGTIVGAGYPVVAVRENDVSIQVGVRDEDLKQIELGQKVQVSTTEGDYIGEGLVNRRATVPDDDHHLYQVEVSMGDLGDDLLVGEVVHLEIVLGDQKGYLVPLAAILVEDVNYIFVNQENLAHKIPVELIDFVGEDVVVEGELEGRELIINNISKLYEGRTIRVVE